MHLDLLYVAVPPQPGQPPVLLYCPTCGEVRSLSANNAAPSYAFDGDEWEEIVADSEQDSTAFLQDHYHHALRLLEKKADRFHADRPVWDPFRIAYEAVTDGDETFLLKSWRTTLDEPRQYGLLRGSLEITTQVHLPVQPLSTTLASSFFLSAQQLRLLIAAFQSSVGALPAQEFVPAYCSADDPQLSFVYLAEHHLQHLLRSCQADRFSIDQAQMWDFLISHRYEEELTIEVRQDSQPCFDDSQMPHSASSLSVHKRRLDANPS
jgi:hypothetical protein